jgi:glycosyltransferase involved in cell wall biosynthesis
VLDKEEVRVVFTGAIYDAHYDGFRALLAALQGLPSRGRLHVYSPMPRSVLSERGLEEGVVFHGYVGAAEMPSVQQGADVLFLPLAFESPFPDVIRTSAPAKMAEYLAAARPLLVHAPPSSFVAEYVRRHECGVVVTEQGPAALRDALEAICRDPALRERLAANAWRRAREDFDLAKARALFADRLGMSRPAA